MIIDLINSLFQLSAGILTWLNIIKIRKDKDTKGMSLVPLFIYCSMGYWNIYFYHHINKPISLIAGLSITAANTIWVLHILYYRKIKK